MCTCSVAPSLVPVSCNDRRSLDVLCLNAGRGGAKDDARDEIDGMETIMLCNVYGHMVLAAELMPLLKATPASRIVTQSSGARHLAKPEKLLDLDGAVASVSQSVGYVTRSHIVWSRAYWSLKRLS